MTFSFVDFSIALVAVLMLLFGMILGTKIGSVVAQQCVTYRDFWLGNAKILGGGIVVSMLVSMTHYYVLAGIPVGAMAAGIAVLKMDFGESVGVWKWHDMFFRVNADQVHRASTKETRSHAQQVRRARAMHEPMPEVMSVTDDASRENAGQNAAQTSAHRTPAAASHTKK